MKNYLEFHVICFFFRSVKNPQEFWSEIAKEFYWETPATEDKFFSYNFDLNKGDIFIKWMEGASTNISFNLLDKNVKSGNDVLEIAFLKYQQETASACYCKTS
ncbi:hypothetical protein E2986_10896 [Frieseomelitta varia]|uniref:Acetyl-coenzyme A synthetase N-terminal domain-containing protein n=1 Tax=Frieseomelitta varia TaxID=561572 RepID=A0A833RZD6_9HYME|nr:hypothetical protein E2986_10896 [Frieseomelitta varia]